MNLIEKYNLKVGDKISFLAQYNTRGYNTRGLEGKKITGMIGEISDHNLFVWNNTHEGSHGDKKPVGYKYSWIVNAYIDIDIKRTKLNYFNCHKLNKQLCILK